jgi:calcium channel MID1
MFDLPFCDGVAYAVPANPQGKNATLVTFDGLKQFYDNYTSFWYQNFANSLQVLPCNTTSNAQYSLAKNCGDCAAAYKEWLCAVSIPRCEDFSNPAKHLQIRNVGQPFYNNNSMLEDSLLQQDYVPMHNAPTVEGTVAFQQTLISSFATNQSRNPDIDQYIAPGPYKEVKPCEDLCFSLMQSCPAALGFACPYRGRGLDVSYGKRGAPGTVECSYIGAYYHQSAAERLTPGAQALMWALTATAVILVVQ